MAFALGFRLGSRSPAFHLHLGPLLGIGSTGRDFRLRVGTRQLYVCGKLTPGAAWWTHREGGILTIATGRLEWVMERVPADDAGLEP